MSDILPEVAGTPAAEVRTVESGIKSDEAALNKLFKAAHQIEENERKGFTLCVNMGKLVCDFWQESYRQLLAFDSNTTFQKARDFSFDRIRQRIAADPDAKITIGDMSEYVKAYALATLQPVVTEHKLARGLCQVLYPCVQVSWDKPTRTIHPDYAQFWAGKGPDGKPAREDWGDALPRLIDGVIKRDIRTREDLMQMRDLLVDNRKTAAKEALEDAQTAAADGTTGDGTTSTPGDGTTGAAAADGAPRASADGGQTRTDDTRLSTKELDNLRKKMMSAVRDMDNDTLTTMLLNVMTAKEHELNAEQSARVARKALDGTDALTLALELAKDANAQRVARETVARIDRMMGQVDTTARVLTTEPAAPVVPPA
jgi:hypothetical protein